MEAVIASRARLFISYCHEDRPWLMRVTEHLAVLERRGLIDVWVDTRIGIGAEWEAEIEQALLASRLALLLISPGFMASTFIWKKEIPHILRHATCGMEVLPLIVRPCAWRLEPSLEKLQARPADGRPLSVVPDAQVDLDLTALVYEVASRLSATNSSLAAREAERAMAVTLPSESSSLSDVAAEPKEVGGRRPNAQTNLAREWSGSYQGDRPIKLVIKEPRGSEFHGQMEYPAEETITTVEGHVEIQRDGAPGASPEGTGVRLIFHETAYERKGARTITFDGEYRGILHGNTINGSWFSGDRQVGAFTLTASRPPRRR